MASNDHPAKAAIVNLDEQHRSRASYRPIECMFNPKEYSFQKQNDWKEGNAHTQNIPQLKFGGGKPATLQMQLFFDTYAEKVDVREKYTDKIFKLMMVDSELKDSAGNARPPVVRFQWGQTWSFDAVITSIKQQFTLFLSNGLPVRATLDVSFRQAQDPHQLKPQNPTSGGAGGERVWRVSAGDTLALIAFHEYGDSTMWRLIADANRLADVRELAPGTILVIPNA